MTEQFDDAWYEEWKRQMVEGGGNVIVALGMRPREANAERVVLEMPMGPNVRQGTGVFAAGTLMQLADVGATMLYWEVMRAAGRDDAPFPLSVQISMNLIGNTDRGTAISESRPVHRGRTLFVVESSIRDDTGKLLATVSSTHVAVAREEKP